MATHQNLIDLASRSNLRRDRVPKYQGNTLISDTSPCLGCSHAEHREIVMTLQIERFGNHFLRSPLAVVLESDYPGMIARTPDIPIFGYGDDWREALDNLQAELAALYEDLLEDNEFTTDWLALKEYLKQKVFLADEKC